MELITEKPERKKYERTGKFKEKYERQKMRKLEKETKEVKKEVLTDFPPPPPSPSLNVPETEQEPEIKIEQDTDDFNELLDEVKTEQETANSATPFSSPPPPPPPPVQTNKVYISGAMFIFCIDFILPNFIKYAYEFTNKNYTIDKENIQLDKQEKEEVIPLANEVVKEIFGNASPMSQFLFYMSIMYMGKLTFAEKKERKKK
jgi:hypothetical protein